ncbi:uncharacterized protein LOC125770256 [Anopheles funestus]|uniref:uncharacterized protein LOC125770256 n=1 Tax=Anopheles funestus TaxID=62324 RepID=UPI0020C69395|nr:uncharacterized protein LOC125770256 [Anopheles funestus]
MGSITIELETPFITPGCPSRILRTIFELLLYNRKQIPFPYQTFRMMVKNVNTDDVDASSVADVQANKQREKAQHVIHCIEMVLDTIDKILWNHPASELMILFGKTIYTVKEAFVIKLPSVDANHFGENHQRTLERMLQNIGLQLTLCDEFVAVQNVQGDTNIFVMLQITSLEPQVCTKYGMNLLDDYQLPRKCATYAINLQMAAKADDFGHEFPYICCKQLEIYSEHTEQSSTSTAIHTTQHKSTDPEVAVKSRWFLLDAVVSGYSMKSAKHFKIWQ